MVSKDVQAPRSRVEAGLDVEVPKIYFNSFVSALGPGDILLVLERNGAPVVTLNTSYAVAKTLARQLANLVEHLESITGTTIMTTEEIAPKLGVAEDDREGPNDG